ncbi:MAG: ATP-dependent ligase [Acidimicrobiales bacterium]|nr:ATP-dependent ligase [Acidimicrobiales bacterium]
MLFADIVATSMAVAATASRTAKSAALAGLLGRAEPEEVEIAVGFLIGEPRQGRIGIGWRTLAAAERPPSEEPTLTVADVDDAITRLGGFSGPGSATARKELLGHLFSRATEDEARFLARLLGGELRQGALAGVMADAVAKAAGVPAAAVRRAVMLGGRLDTTARVALTDGLAGLESVHLEVGRPVQPMLASTAATVTEAVEALGDCSVEWKLDGIRIQAHRDGDAVTLYTRNLNDITSRLPEVADVVRSLPATSLVLDGEALVLGDGGRPVMFQDTAGRVSADGRVEAVLPHFFDVIHVDGVDLVDEPLSVRLAELERVAGPWRIPGTVTADPTAAEAVLRASLAAGHEGVVAKGLASPYEAGRRGKAWRKVKPVHTFDLVVLAVEWGSGRRTGWLSNLHLGARADDGSGFVMVGKTFKGLTDELLRWQTERFLALAEREELWAGRPQSGVVWVRPEQVVEIALDGVQRSTRYPGGIALRFARVVRYRDDKDPADVDLLSSLTAMLPG